LVFPEGTRNVTKEPVLHFKKGPFVAAIQMQYPILPVVFHGGREIQERHSYRVASGEMVLEVLTPIPVTGCTYRDRKSLGEEAHRQILEAYLRGPGGDGHKENDPEVLKESP